MLGRTLVAGERAVVRCCTQDMLTALDDALWASAPPDWLPHGTARDGDADLQPIWITLVDEAPNGARFLFLLEGSETARLSDFARVFDLFDGNDPAAVAAARIRWSVAKASGHTLAYWQQGERSWERKS